MTLTDTFVAAAPPLRVDEDGAVRVGKTRVTLDTVIGAFKEGATAEDILLRYPSLDRADIYGVIAYYLRHTQEVEDYLAQRRQEAEELRRKIEELCPPDDFRERLLARRTKKQGA
jgi:uncharacterized protein (DUF433 family)